MDKEVDTKRITLKDKKTNYSYRDTLTPRYGEEGR